MIVGKPLTLHRLQAEMATAGLLVDGLILRAISDTEGDLLAVSPDGEQTEPPAGTQPVVDAHVADLPTLEHAGRVEVDRIVRTTDATVTEVFRFTTATLHVYRATFSLLAVDAGNGTTKDQEARFTFKRTLAASPVQVGATAVLYAAQDTGAAAWAIVPSVDQANLVISVQGAAGRTIDWLLVGSIARYAPEGLA